MEIPSALRFCIRSERVPDAAMNLRYRVRRGSSSTVSFSDVRLPCAS
jgi:hypothetical protein